MTDSEIELWIVEYWSVPDANVAAFLDYYHGPMYRSLSGCRGYAGFAWLEPVRSGVDLFGAAPAARVISPHPGMSTLGVRTDAMVNFDALLQREYNFVGVQFWRDRTIRTTLADDFIGAWEALHPRWREENPQCADPWDVLNRDFYSLCENHWDAVYDVSSARGVDL